MKDIIITEIAGGGSIERDGTIIPTELKEIKKYKATIKDGRYKIGNNILNS